MSWTDKVVLLTGACSGIGTATAEHFVGRGAKIVLVGRNEEHLKATETLCKSVNNDSECLIIAADILENSKSIIDRTLERFGRLDVLVNYAGTLTSGGILDIVSTEFEHVLNNNLRAVFLMTKLSLNHLIANEGTIINVSCISDSKPNANSLAVSVSKSALDKFSQCIALELKSKNIRVFSIDPGTVLTELQKSRNPATAESVNKWPSIKEAHTEDVNEVAKAITYLAFGDL